VKLIHLDELPTMPWKNGGGVTRELACFPANASINDFIWRVSIAEIAHSGPFSNFSGVDRIITLLDGDGMHLEFSNGHVHELTTPLVPYFFNGEDRLYARLVGTPCQDINLMLRHGAAAGKVEIYDTSDVIACEPGFLLLLGIKGKWAIITPEGIACALVRHNVLTGVCLGGPLIIRPETPDSALMVIRIVPTAAWNGS
jgi:uncharacterized protein